jgi:hypothetical protein
MFDRLANWLSAHLFCAHCWIRDYSSNTPRDYAEAHVRRRVPYRCIYCGKVTYQRYDWIPLNYCK